MQLFLDTYGSERAGDAEVIKRLCMTPACFGVVGYIKGDPAGFIMLQQAGESADIIEICVRPLFRIPGLAASFLNRRSAVREHVA